MTWGNRFRLLLGTLMVLVLVAGATFVFNQRATQVESSSASIGAAMYGVGTDYSGLVTESFVTEGDHVGEGQRMFVIESLQLERDVENGLVSADEPSVNSDAAFVVRASTSGTVGAVAIGEGGYAQAGDVLATIEADGTLFAQAEFVLSGRDFGRLEEAATVELMLPDRRTLTGTVADIDVETLDGEAHVTARVESIALEDSRDDALVKPGTPLEATLDLRDDGPLAGVEDMVRDFAARIGL
ncbi:HlyD family efflux transporter periplasmic adaptor subunit [Demequina activiva]|uniref:HlyD family secretion protein n=1 Tax=Demequina activiva TaxID=1582364 RepID=A0A919Q281_9MICO|nr:HlyD family secretion protein [Demequina activiva]GIG54877.1 hypothetical protein Dac01nite_16290 [Demequina activiva]